MKPTMKKILLSVALAVLGLYTFTGCGKQTEYPNSVLATIDTIVYNAPGEPAVIFRADTSTHNPQKVFITSKTNIYIPGTATQPALSIVVPNAVGYYAVPSAATASVVTSATGSGGSAAVSGWVQVVKKYSNNRIEGQFSFVSANGTVVKDGQFNGIYGLY